MSYISLVNRFAFLGLAYCLVYPVLVVVSIFEMNQNWKAKKGSSYFENNFPIFFFFGNLITSIFKMRNVLHCLHFLEMKSFSNIFRSTFCWGQVMFEYILYPIEFLLFPTNFIYIREWSLIILDTEAEGIWKFIKKFW